MQNMYININLFVQLFVQIQATVTGTFFKCKFCRSAMQNLKIRSLSLIKALIVSFYYNRLNHIKLLGTFRHFLGTF